jgi:hypothetical protein
MCFQPFKSSVRIYRTFFKGINGNSGGEKEKQGVGREIFFLVAPQARCFDQNILNKGLKYRIQKLNTLERKFRS